MRNRELTVRLFRLQMWIWSVFLCLRPVRSLFPLNSVLLGQISIMQNFILCSMLLCSDCFTSYNQSLIQNNDLFKICFLG